MVGAKLQRLLSLEPIETRQRFNQRDTIIYALGIGCGLDSGDPSDLRYVLEDRLEAFPTMATVLAYPGFWFDREDLGLDWRKIMLQAQYLELYHRLPVEGEVVGRTRVTGARDRGPGRGAVIAVEREIRDFGSGRRLATATSLVALRGDGEAEGSAGTMPPRLPAIDEGCALEGVEMPTLAGQPLIYRLSGDLNPIHADPEVARAAGFDRPIMHGLCTFGIAARAVVKAACAGDAGGLAWLGAVFVGPVVPGNSIEVRTETHRGSVLRFDASSEGSPVLASGLARRSREAAA